VDATRLIALIDALEADPGQDPHSLMLVRHGHVVAAGWWAPYTRHGVQLLYSLSKSFTSTAAGFAVAEGLLDLDERVVDAFPEFDGDISDARTRSMRVRHLASMSTGHIEDMLWPAMRTDPVDPVRGFLAHPPERDPGTIFTYNQMATYTLAAIIGRRAGMSLSGYLEPRLFEPLGLPRFRWFEYPPGRAVGFTGLYATTDAIARLGQLYLAYGRWGDRQILSADWISRATTARIDTVWDDDIHREPALGPDWVLGYGFQFWMSRFGYRGDGAFGQFCLVLPDHDTVVAYTGATNDLQRTLDLIWERMLPALQDVPLEGPGSAAADRHLRERLSALRVAAPREMSVPGRPSTNARRALRLMPPRDAPWDDVVLRPVPGSVQTAPAPTALEITRVDGCWRVTLIDSTARIEAALGSDDWTISGKDLVPVAVLGGWDDGGALRFDVIFLETPHRLEVRCVLDADHGTADAGRGAAGTGAAGSGRDAPGAGRATGTFVAAWQTAPLVDRAMGLGDLRSPPGQD